MRSTAGLPQRPQQTENLPRSASRCSHANGHSPLRLRGLTWPSGAAGSQPSLWGPVPVPCPPGSAAAARGRLTPRGGAGGEGREGGRKGGGSTAANRFQLPPAGARRRRRHHLRHVTARPRQ